MAKAFPDSFTPLRFMIIMKMTKPTEICTRNGNKAGNADTICATPEETETAGAMVQPLLIPESETLGILELQQTNKLLKNI
jgi:hypothetical protein